MVEWLEKALGVEAAGMAADGTAAAKQRLAGTARPTGEGDGVG